MALLKSPAISYPHSCKSFSLLQYYRSSTSCRQIWRAEDGAEHTSFGGPGVTDDREDMRLWTQLNGWTQCDQFIDESLWDRGEECRAEVQEQ